MLAGFWGSPHPAYADCELAVTAVCNGSACGSESRPVGRMTYNQDFDLIQVCRADGTWAALSAPGCPDGDCGPDPCADSPSPGTTCRDGTIYAGLSPDGNVPMYTTPADASSGAYWGTFGFPTGSTSDVTGRDNTADIYAYVQNGDGSHNPDDGYTPNAAVLCEELTAHGHSDWYLPDELDVLYDNLVDQNGDNTPGGPLGSTFSFNTSGSAFAGWY